MVCAVSRVVTVCLGMTAKKETKAMSARKAKTARRGRKVSRVRKAIVARRARQERAARKARAVSPVLAAWLDKMANEVVTEIEALLVSAVKEDRKVNLGDFLSRKFGYPIPFTTKVRSSST